MKIRQDDGIKARVEMRLAKAGAGFFWIFERVAKRLSHRESLAWGGHGGHGGGHAVGDGGVLCLVSLGLPGDVFWRKMAQALSQRQRRINSSDGFVRTAGGVFPAVDGDGD